MSTAGMECPECDGRTYVIDSRRTVDNVIRRRRVCVACGLRFATYERPPTDYELVFQPPSVSRKIKCRD